jgi:hypothetical protein
VNIVIIGEKNGKRINVFNEEKDEEEEIGEIEKQ